MKLLSFAFTKITLAQKMPYYAVAVGRKVGIFSTWPECEKQVKNFNAAKFKKFKLKSEAEDFLRNHGNRETITNIVGNDFKNKVEEFWPEEECNDADNEDLLAALAEVEGIPANPESRLSSLKRKTDSVHKDLKSKITKHDSTIWEPIGLKKYGHYEFLIDSEGFVIVYTDGSCINNGKANAVAGFGVYFGKNHAMNVAKPVKGRVTNNAGEIQAAIYAIQVAKNLGIEKLCLSTDSQFLINSVTLWMKSWKRRFWKLKTGEPVKNVDDFKVLDDLLDGTINIKWNYVKGHAGIEGNEMADQLAREGSEMYRKIKK